MHIIFHTNGTPITTTPTCLSKDGGRVGSLVLPGRRELLLGLVVAGKTVDTGLDQNKTELRVLVLSVGLKMLANSNRLLDQEPQILGDRRCKA
jgi:hypothetical protein